MTDSELVPRGKGEKNPCQGSETGPEITCLQTVVAGAIRWPLAFCIMSPRVIVGSEVKGGDVRSRSESECEARVQLPAIDPKPCDLPMGRPKSP